MALNAALVIAALSYVACLPTEMVLSAQTLPYPLTVEWDASPDAATYTCYLDGTAVVTGVTALTCTMPVAAAGPHTVAVTAVNPAFVPAESAPVSLSFKLQAPTSAKSVRVK
jgi:hypothetical protein